MIDNPSALATVGNIYEYVLIASERMREIYIHRKDTGLDKLPPGSRKNKELPHDQVAREILSGEVGLEYLKKIRNRERRNKHTMR